MECPIPDGQVDNLALITIQKNSPEWKAVEDRFNLTMTGKGTVSSIVKVSNKMLWCVDVLFGVHPNQEKICVGKRSSYGEEQQ